jgi:hypothetical protein
MAKFHPPSWFAGLPWPIRWALIAGGSLVSAFSSRLPAEWQDFGLYCGLAIVAYGILATIWHHCLKWHDSRKQRGMVGLDSFYFIVSCFAVAIIATGTGAYSLGLKYSAKTYPQQTETGRSEPQNLATHPDGLRSVFESLSGGKISGQGMTVHGQLPPGFARTETGGQIILDKSNINVVPSLNFAFIPPDGTLKALSKNELHNRLLSIAQKLREDDKPTEWTSLALEGRSLASEALTRVKKLNVPDARGGTAVLFVYIPDRMASLEAATFLEALAAAVQKL